MDILLFSHLVDKDKKDYPPTMVVLLGGDPSGQDMTSIDEELPAVVLAFGGNSDGSSSSDDGGVNAGNTVTGLTGSTVIAAALSSTKSSAITGIISGSINMITVKEEKIPELNRPQRECCMFFNHLAHI